MKQEELQELGLAPEEGTRQAMMALAPLMERLARERVFQELCQILPLVTAGDMARFAPVLTQPIPELGATVGFDQRSPHHAYDLYTHISHVVAATPPKLTLRWAALLHDVGKVPTFTQDSTGHNVGRPILTDEHLLRRLLRLRKQRSERPQVTTKIPGIQLIHRSIRLQIKRVPLLLERNRGHIHQILPKAGIQRTILLYQVEVRNHAPQQTL